MIFKDYNETKFVYHVASITDLNQILSKGIFYDDKSTYRDKYYNFHKYIDSFKPGNIPAWVIRSKAIFASLNFHEKHCWHSHSVVLGIKIDPDKCWIANENLANEVYEPFILKGVKGFSDAGKYLEICGEKNMNKYWETSLSFKENLKIRRDSDNTYDAEVMIFHSIYPEDIKPLYIVSDHRMMSIKEWKSLFIKGE